MLPHRTTKNHRGGAPLSPRDDMYLDEQFKRIVAPLQSPVCTPKIYREAKLCFKLYSVAHTKRYLSRKNCPQEFKYGAELIAFAIEQKVPQHYVECWLDAFSSQHEPKYVPMNNYPEYDLTKATNIYKTQKQIMIDMEYVARKYFGKFPKALEGQIAKESKLELDVLPATKFIVQMLKFMFFDRIPAQIDGQLYKRLYDINVNIATYYSYEPENGVASRKKRDKDYGAMIVLGERLAVEIFTHPNEYCLTNRSNRRL